MDKSTTNRPTVEPNLASGAVRQGSTPEKATADTPVVAPKANDDVPTVEREKTEKKDAGASPDGASTAVKH